VHAGKKSNIEPEKFRVSFELSDQVGNVLEFKIPIFTHRMFLGYKVSFWIFFFSVDDNVGRIIKTLTFTEGNGHDVHAPESKIPLARKARRNDDIVAVPFHIIYGEIFQPNERRMSIQALVGADDLLIIVVSFIRYDEQLFHSIA